MKIVIVSYFFEPEITPRAYRTAELAKAFARRGHEVTVVLPNKALFADLPRLYDGIRFRFGEGPILTGGPNAATGKVRRALPQWLVRAILYIYNHEYFAKYDKGIFRRLCAMQGEYDLLISVSYPVAIHRAVINAFRRNKSLTARCKVAEFSDPPMRGEYNSSYLPLYDRFMRRAGRFFDRFIVPVENALPVYLPFKPASKISVIPQGFDNSGIVLPPYKKNDRPTFAFAGRFYRNTRDPEPLLSFLADSGRDFRFDLYLIDRDPYFDEMLGNYRQLCRGEIAVHAPLPRNRLIPALATADFLVNHNFNYGTATPSKLIDYSLTGRPVYSFSSDRFDSTEFTRFLDGDYGGAATLPDPSVYDIVSIARSFEALAAE